MKRTLLASAFGVGLALLSAAPALAGSAVVTPTPASPGGFVTITITCTDQSGTVTFAGDPAVFVGGGAFNSVSSGSANGLQLLPGLAPGAYPETFVCNADVPETLQATIVVAAPTPTPSGAPETGGGGASSSSPIAGGVAIVLGGLVGAGMLVARRRCNA